MYCFILQGLIIMTLERTLSIVKPDATRRNITGLINAKLEAAGLRIVAQKRIRISVEQAKQLYYVLRDKPFYTELLDVMTSAPVVVQVLEGENAVQRNREIMGNTDPQKAEIGTIRKEFAESVGSNSVHGSDSLENAKNEIALFFSAEEIVG